MAMPDGFLAAALRTPPTSQSSRVSRLLVLVPPPTTDARDQVNSPAGKRHSSDHQLHNRIVPRHLRDRGEADAPLLPVKGGVVAPQNRLAEGIHALEGGLLQV